MLYTGLIGDLYIGRKAGKKLIQDIKAAQKSIKIVSPYLSPHLISELISLNGNDLSIELITTDTIEESNDGKQSNIRQLIIQNRDINEKALSKKAKWLKVIEHGELTCFILLVISLSIVHYFNEPQGFFVLIPIVVLLILNHYLFFKVQNIKIYSYWYSQLFPFKVYMTPYSSPDSKMFIHSKVYIIDEAIAYVGSLNFTSSGINHNYETSIRITEREALDLVLEEFYDLMNHVDLPERSIQGWGRILYDEPIN